MSASSRPKAYKNGFQDFYGRNFVVSPDVLIPRPETEQLIDEVLSLAGRSFLPGVKAPAAVLPEDLTIIDVGTGSGCIAITLSLELPKATVIATDISESALKIAQENSGRLNAPIKTIIAHLLENVKTQPDLVVANLPYVDENWDWLDKKALSFEPKIALYADDHGLKLIKELIDQCSERKIPHLILEADPCQHAEIVEYAKKYHLMRKRGFCLSLKYSD